MAKQLPEIKDFMRAKTFDSKNVHTLVRVTVFGTEKVVVGAVMKKFDSAQAQDQDRETVLAPVAELCYFAVDPTQTRLVRRVLLWSLTCLLSFGCS